MNVPSVASTRGAGTTGGADTPGGRPPRRMSPQQRRDHLITTALGLYGRQAPEDVSVDDIVTAADVSRALFYRYFTNIREMHLAALGRVVDDLIDRLALLPGEDLRQRLRAMVAEFIAFTETYATSYTALLRSGSTIATSATDTLVDRVREHVLGLFCTLLEPEAPSPMLERTVRGWISVVETTVLSWLRAGDLSRDELAAWLVDQFFAMLATTAAHDGAAAEQAGRLSPAAAQPPG